MPCWPRLPQGRRGRGPRCPAGGPPVRASLFGSTFDRPRSGPGDPDDSRQRSLRSRQDPTVQAVVRRRDTAVRSSVRPDRLAVSAEGPGPQTDPAASAPTRPRPGHGARPGSDLSRPPRLPRVGDRRRAGWDPQGRTAGSEIRNLLARGTRRPPHGAAPAEGRRGLLELRVERTPPADSRGAVRLVSGSHGRRRHSRGQCIRPAAGSSIVSRSGSWRDRVPPRRARSSLPGLDHPRVEAGAVRLPRDRGGSCPHFGNGPRSQAEMNRCGAAQTPFGSRWPRLGPTRPARRTHRLPQFGGSWGPCACPSTRCFIERDFRLHVDGHPG
jgi:hypothetical protein